MFIELAWRSGNKVDRGMWSVSCLAVAYFTCTYKPHASFISDNRPLGKFTGPLVDGERVRFSMPAVDGLLKVEIERVSGCSIAQAKRDWPFRKRREGRG